jgi:HPt (histidine-containing phosphotransfer) domain-containing protein
MDPASQPALNEALDRMWIQFLPQIKERLAILDSAAAAFAANQLTKPQHEAANAAAHKLAGILGSFGLTKGTVLARELEIMYSRDGGPDPALGAQLTSIAAKLRAMVESRKVAGR